jgi:WD40 repeat protein
MNIALYGASSSGLVGVLKVDDASGIGHQPIGRFHNLSSVSMNCTDDYFLVSGFSRDVLLFDLVSGQRVLELKEIHSNFINIVRFAHFSPHLFATSSFDSTCKLWDLRAPRAAVAQYATPTLNVMCCFSPLDDNLLVSGLDSNVVQLSVRKGLVPNIPADRLAASIPARNSASNYRRAVYLANGDNFITSGTDENFMRVIDSRTGISRGVRKFDGLLEAFEKKLAESGSNVPKSAEEIHLTSDGGSTGGSQLQSDPNTTHRTDEYVQSLRGHPIFPKEVGVLLYPFDRSRSSYVCTAQIPN